MKLSELKSALNQVNDITISLPNGGSVPAHFHLTELGLVTKHFIDCGGDIHVSKAANLQIWVADDVDHRLSPVGFLKIIEMGEKILGNEDLDMEVEYQTETIGKYGLEFIDGKFQLTAKATDCLAKVDCLVPPVKKSFDLSSMMATESTCTPGGGCC